MKMNKFWFHVESREETFHESARKRQRKGGYPSPPSNSGPPSDPSLNLVPKRSSSMQPLVQPSWFVSPTQRATAAAQSPTAAQPFVKLPYFLLPEASSPSTSTTGPTLDGTESRPRAPSCPRCLPCGSPTPKVSSHPESHRPLRIRVPPKKGGHQT